MVAAQGPYGTRRMKPTRLLPLSSLLALMSVGLAPYVLGISGGAAVAALGAMLLGLGGLIVDWAAGCLCS